MQISEAFLAHERVTKVSLRSRSSNRFKLLHLNMVHQPLEVDRVFKGGSKEWKGKGKKGEFKGKRTLCFWWCAMGRGKGKEKSQKGK